MTSNTDKLRAVFLTALMIGSVLVAGIAFTGSAAAAATSLSVNNAPVDHGETLKFSVTDDSSDTGDVYVWIDTNEDGYYNSSETSVTVSSSGESSATTTDDSIVVPSSLSAGTYTLAAAENSTLTAGTTTQNVTTTFDVTATKPAFSGAIEFQSSDGTDGDIELAFTEGVSANSSGTPAIGLADGSAPNNVTVYLNGNDVTSDFNFKSASADAGTFVLQSSKTITPQDTLKVHVGTITDSGGDVATPGNITVTTTSRTVDLADVTSNPYQGEVVAIDFGSPDQAFEITKGGEFQGSFSSGTNSQLFAWDTEGKSTSATFNVTSGTPTKTIQFKLRNLGLTNTIDTKTITTEEKLTGSLSANAGGRTITVKAYYANNDSLAMAADGSPIELSSSGTGSYTFSNLAAGNYYIEATDVKSGVTATVKNVTVNAAANTNPTFTSTLYEDERGDVLNVSIDINKDGGSGYVFLGGKDASYEKQLKVSDGSDSDSTVTIQFNTYYPNSNESDSKPGDTFSAYVADSSVSTADSVTVVKTIRGGDVSKPLAAIGYDLNATTTGMTETSVSSINLKPRTTPSVKTWVAPDSAAVSSPSKIVAAATQQSSTAMGDKVVFQISASSFEGFMADSDFSAMDLNKDNKITTGSGSFTEGVHLTVKQTSASGNENPTTINVSNATLVKDLDSNQIFVAFDTGSSKFNFAAGETYQATFTVNESSPYIENTNDGVEQSETFTSSISLQTQSTTFDGLNSSNYLNLPAKDNVTVSGTSNLAPGTNISVTIRSSGNFLLKNPTVTVQEDGTWSTTFDLGSYSAGTQYTVTATDATSRTGILQKVTTTTTTEQTTEQTTTTTEQTTTTTKQTTTTTKQTTTTTEQTTEQTTTTTSGSGGGTPGFTVGIALVAIIGAAFLALREN